MKFLTAKIIGRHVSSVKKNTTILLITAATMAVGCKRDNQRINDDRVSGTYRHPGALAAAPSVGSISAGSWIKIAQASGSNFMHFPRGISFDIESGGAIVKKALINWQTNPDVVQFPMTHGWTGSVGPGTWNSPSPTNTPEIDMMACIRRNSDGVLIAIPFYLGYTGANPNPPFIFSYHTSTNNGTTWVNQANAGTVTGFPAGQQLAGIRFHRGIIQDADGTLYAPAHAQWRVGGAYETFRSMLLKSTDGGATWTYLSTIQYTAGLNYTETAIVRCKDGSILAVMRNATGSTINGLKYKRSTDNGATWGSVNFLPGIPTNMGVDPELKLMPNGVLVLSYGDNIPSGNMRDCMLAFSEDGNGTTWTDVTETFTSSTSGLGNKSSGYTAIFPVSFNRFVLVSDRGANAYYGSSPSPNPFSIWTRTIDMNLNYNNALDLKSMLADGYASVSTDMTYSNATHPEARTSAPFDGSTDYWSGAFKMASSGTYTIDLQKNYLLNAMAVCLLYGRQQSATFEYSQNGSTWTTFKSYTNVTQYTTDYTSFSPISARYIRVSSTGSAGIVGLNELQLYTLNDTFENYTINVPPAGYSLLNTGFWVSQGVVPLPTGYLSKKALCMEDADGQNKEISKTSFSSSGTKTLEFMLRTKNIASAGCIQFRLMSGATNVFRMAVFPNGSIKYYNGSWVTLPGTPVPADTWKAIKVVANASANTASIYVDGSLIGTASKETAGATTMNGFLFGSGGSSVTGDKALFDDVALY